MTVLVLRSLDAGYGGVPVVRDLDLEVDSGEVLALLGPNGAGKTTILSTISGLIPRVAGEVEILGEPDGFPAPVPGGAARCCARGRGPVVVLRPHRQGEPPSGSRSGSERASRGVPTCVRPLPAAPSVGGPSGRSALRRRTADVGDGPGDHHQPASAPRRRDESRPRSCDRAADDARRAERGRHGCRGDHRRAACAPRSRAGRSGGGDRQRAHRGRGARQQNSVATSPEFRRGISADCSTDRPVIELPVPGPGKSLLG